MSLKKLLLTGLLFLILPSNHNFKECKIDLTDYNTSLNFILEREKIEAPWKTVNEYDAFVRSTVNNYYISDVKEIYDFYNIKRDLPKYGFKAKKMQIICFDCEGAIYKEDVDSIYFYSTCSEELFNRYLEYFEKSEEDIKEELTKRLHHSIKHEAAHAFYYEFGKRLGEKYLFELKRENTSVLYDIQHNLVEEGVADYISYKGELTESAKRLSNEDFKKMIETKNDFYLYELGFLLVKPILDKDFKKGVEELIKNPLSEKDLNDLPKYREKIMDIVKEF